MDDDRNLKPRQSVRRFDVFAEFERQNQIDKGEPPDVAKGLGIWLAKVVASGAKRKKKGEGAPLSSAKKDTPNDTPDVPASKWKSLDGKEQTDQLFDQEIIDHMGEQFYTDVFVPTIELARERGEKYMDIRDSIREDWKLPKSAR